VEKSRPKGGIFVCCDGLRVGSSDFCLGYRPACADLQADTFPPLKVGNNSKQVAGGWISLWAKHLVRGLHVQLRLRGQLWKPHRGIDVVTQELLPQRNLSGDKTFNGIAEQPLAKCSVTSHSRLYRFSEIPC
jgi:hypothetical protein